MLVNHNRQKLINAMLFFVNNTKRCHKLKLFKLLYLLDFEHYRQTGRTVTGEHYNAWRMGPVPSRLFKELKDPSPDLAAALGIVMSNRDSGFAESRPSYTIDSPPPEGGKESAWSNYNTTYFKPRQKFDPKYFSRREIGIMKVIAEIFDDASASDMSEFSHMRQLPWRKVFGKGEGDGKPIPFDLALQSDPIVFEQPTIDPTELAYRKAALAEVDRSD